MCSDGGVEKGFQLYISWLFSDEVVARVRQYAVDVLQKFNT